LRRYLLQRLVASGLVVLGVVTLVFFLMRLSGDPVLLYVSDRATPEQVEQMRRQLGFDRPLIVQYAEYMRRAFLRLDFGESLRYREPAVTVVTRHFPATLELAAAGLFIALALALPLGILSAVYRDSVLDAVTRVLALIGQSVPIFWLGIVLILFFAVRLHVLPSSGRGGWEYLVMPGLVLGANSAGLMMRVLRSSMLTVLEDDYIRTAYAKGLERRTVLLRHALKNAAIPFVTLIGIRIGYLLSGAVITEYVFGYPGIGRVTLQAVFNRDFPVVQTFVAISAAMMVTINFAVDMVYAWLDPRITYDG
jgi:peptide/nickel transport system permease protein